MPRLSRALVEERETFTTNNFKAGMSVEEAQTALVGKYNGVKMNPYRLQELFDQVNQSGEPAVVAEPQEEAPKPEVSLKDPFAPKSKSILCREFSLISEGGEFHPISRLVELIESDLLPTPEDKKIAGVK